MRKRTVRTTLAAGVLAAGSVFFVDLATGPASGATVPTVLTDQQRHVIAGYHADRMVVDGVHQRLLIADDVTHRILSTRYDGTVTAEVALPGGMNAGELQLSADSGTLWATIPDANTIISWNAATLEETASYPLAVHSLGHLVLAGGKAWFTYGGNYFASLDPATGEMARFVLGDGNDTSGSGRQPLIAASPTDPNRLALTYANTQSWLFLYDVGGGTATLVTRADTGLLYGQQSLKFTTDGTMIYVGGVGGVFYTWADDPGSSQARTIAMDRAADVETASNGWIAVGLPPTTNATDLRLYKAGQTVSTREFDIPIATGAPQLVDLAWGPGAGELFAITADQAGAQNLWVIGQPTVVPVPSAPGPTAATTATTIKLSGPASASPDSGINIQGTLSGPKDVTPLVVTRTDAGSPAGVVLPTVWANLSGYFSVLDFPTAEGTVTYTVAYAGDRAYQPSSAKISVLVSKPAPALTLDRNGSVNAYGATVAITAHLGATYRNRTVEIWADPYGADQARRLIKKGAVNSAGNLTVTYKLARNTTFTAVFTGDTVYAARTVNSTVRTRVAVATTVARHYKVKSQYHLVRRTKNPTFTTTTTPYPGRTARLVLERYSGGRWVAWKAGTFKLSAAGRYTFTLGGTHQTGVKYRARSVYLTGTSGDSVNHTTYGPWKYFTFTK